MKRIRLFIAATMLLLSVGGPALFASTAAADTSPQNEVCTVVAGNSDCSGTPKNGLDINHVIAAIVNILSVIVGVAAVIVIMIAGFRFITAAGDSNQIASARTAIIYAIVGVIIVLLAQALVRMVLDRVTH